MDVAANNAPIEKMNAELAKRDAELEELRAMITTLQANAKNSKRAVAATPEAAE